MDSYKFNIVKNTLEEESSRIATLEIENNYYKIRIHYFGDYIEDKENYTMDKFLVAVVCKPKGLNLSMNYMEFAYLNDTFDFSGIRISDVDKTIERLNIFKYSAIEFEKIMNEYFKQYYISNKT